MAIRGISAGGAPSVFARSTNGRLRRIGDFDEALAAEQSESRVTGAQLGWLAQNLRKSLGEAAHRRSAEILAIEKLQIPTFDAAKLMRLLQYRVEHRRKIAGRGVDDLQHLGGRSLLSERLVAVGSALGKLALQIGYEPLEIG
jgi:hypothetical protein